ncbi:MAG TPA: 2-dehydro-3-deoxyphosphogluconate aldolase, partial [Verrucomicrobiae bacterium]
ALAAPFKHIGIRFAPSGGVTTGNLETYLKHWSVAAAGGTWIAKPEDLSAGNWKEIQARCKAVLEIIAKARSR